MGALEDKQADNVVDYLSMESKGRVLRRKSIETFIRAKEKEAG